LEKEKLIDIFRKMVFMRVHDESMVEIFARGKLYGFVHPIQGEEAYIAGAIAALNPNDYILSTHRTCRSTTIARGADLKRVVAEQYGKKTGYRGGKGGEMHLADLETYNLGGDGVVGANIPIAAGAALSIKLGGTKEVVICFFGDGASNHGTFHEGINMAAIWKLPVIFFCANNGYAVSVPSSPEFSLHPTSASIAPGVNIADRAIGYGIPGVIVDGTDPLAVYEATREAVSRAREGKGPTLIEAKCYRFRGHFEGMDESFIRTKEEVARKRKEFDPIPKFKAKLIQMGLLTEEDATRIEEDARAQQEEAIKFAEESPFPEPVEALRGVYAS
jgi:TPP-dependent pyruvate/acetoin dehydrogenase alpha subunit